MNTKGLDNQKQGNYVLLIEEDGITKSVILEKDTYSIGRQKNNSIVLKSPQVSRTHAIIRRKKQKEKYLFFIEDGNFNGKKSFNGIFLGKERISKHQLKHGDVIRIGKEVNVTFYVSYDLENFTENIQPSSYLASDQEKFKQTVYLEPNDRDDSTSFVTPKDTLEDKPDDEFLKLSSILELCPNPIIEIDYQGNFTYVNPSAHLVFNDLEKLKNKHPLFFQIMENKDQYKGEILKREIKIRKETYEQYIHYLAGQDFIRFYLFNITQRKKLEKNLKYNAYYDPLTNLPNRRFFDKTLKRIVANAKRKQKQFAIFFLDIDGFKHVNDTFGHKAGDQLLRGFADKLKSSIREGDIVFRWAGDEFTILVTEIEDLTQPTRIAKRIIEEMTKPITVNEENLYVTTSIGISLYPEDGTDGELLIKNADTALYKAKLNGKNQYCYHNPQLNSQILNFLASEHDLYQAIEEKQFFLHYQPQINLKTGKIECFEALLRWNHPVRGILMPNEFLSLTEDTGLIIPITEWVINTVCQQNSIWHQKHSFDFRIGVNISASLFKQFNLAKIVFKALEKHNLPPYLLELEITEDTMISHIQSVRENFMTLLTNDVKITIDDFGIGCSSLMNLKKIPFHYLKISQHFIQELSNNLQDRAIISAIITMARGLNLQVIAEGVENKANWDLLSELGCDYLQGYLLSKPLPADEVIPFLQNS